MEELLKLLANIDQKQIPLEDNQTYCLISARWPKYLEQSFQQKKDLSQIPFLNAELVLQNQKDIIPLVSIDQPFQRNDAKNKIDYKCISNEEWEQLIKQIVETEAIPKQNFKFEVISRKDKLVSKFSYINLLPIYEGITRFIQGIQRFSRDWTPQQAIDALELAFQDQLLIQVPKNNFIKLYAVQEKIQNFSTLIEKCQTKQITLIELSDSMDKYDQAYIVMDIKVLNKDYYFIEQKAPEQIIPIALDSDEFTKKGLSRFEDQNSLTSCILKCYEVIDKYRNYIKENLEYSKLYSIIQQSYNNYSEITYYNSQDVQYLKEQQIRPSLSRTEKILVQREPVYVELNHKKTLRQLIEELLPNKKPYFECSNNYYTDKVNLDRPSNELPLDYIYNLTEASTEEDLIEVTVHKCIMENDGILKTYKNFDVIRKFEINNNLKYFDLHLTIANLYQKVDMDTYKNEIVNKQFELIFKTSQTNNEKCLYCDQKLCNNCIVPFIDKKLQLKVKQVQIYAIYQQIDARLIEQPQFEQQYKLEDFFNFEQQTDETLTLDIQQPHPYLLQYPLKIGKYSLEGVIEQISRNQYNCYCRKGEKWILFNDQIEVEINNKLNTVKLFYCKID